jgi:probable HAF family extracellular repeat protein
MLGDLGGALSYALGVNDSGMVVGHAATAGNQLHAFLYDGSMRDLGTLGGSHSYAYGVNAAGWAVGHSWLANGPASHAFVYNGAGMLDLNGLVLNGDGWELLEAYSVNDAGQIVGAGLYHGQRTAFRLDPAESPLTHNPEPGTVSMMALGLGLLAVGFWRRKRGG